MPIKNYTILICSVFVIFACKPDNDNNIAKIKIWYYNGIFERCVSVDCDEIVFDSEKIDTIAEYLDNGDSVPKDVVVLESFITDKQIIKEITEELQKREEIKDDNIDARMKCYFIFENGDTDSLCIDNNPTFGRYNNHGVRLNNKLIYLLRNSCGFYRWIGADYMQYVGELNDKTFVRDKVTAFGGETY